MAPALMVDPTFVARFEQEARTVAQLRHPNIVTVFDVDRHDGLHYFVMEYVPGPTLRQIMTDRHGESLPVPIVLHWVSQVASALDYAHRAGTVHRDVKPANIQLDAYGDARVTDFGIAKVAHDAGLTRTGFLVGTSSYMSPEQCAAEAVTGASDQYVLGVVAYELLAGRPPFAGPTMEVVQSHLTRTPPALGELRPDCPEQVRSGIERMLSKRPEERYPSATAAAAALGAQALPDAHPDRALLARLSGSTRADAELPKARGREDLRTPTLPPTLRAPIARGQPTESHHRPARGRAVRLLGLLTIIAASFSMWAFWPDGVERVDEAGVDDAGVDAWRYESQTDALAYAVTVRPRVPAPREQLDLELDLRTRELEQAVISGEADARMRFEFFVDHRVVAEVAPQVDESGRLHVSVSLPDPGKYHVDVEILGESRELTPFGFDICVGADADRAPEEFERLCPSMNAH